MITLKQFMETVSYRITEGSNYGWSCYGDYTHSLSSWNGVHSTGGWSADAVFDTQTQTVYEVQVCDYSHNRAYRLINPEFAEAHRLEANQRNINMNEAWDSVNWVDLAVDEDWLEKAQAIVAGQDYDDRVQIYIDFSDEDLLNYMKAAHQQDITFNQFVEQALKSVINERQKNGNGKNSNQTQ